MKILAISAILLASFAQSADKPPMVQPKITHHDEVTQQHYDRVDVTCPEGYEGHFVDIQVGFDAGYGMWQYGERTPQYAVCFDKQFMDKVRANPDLKRYRPILKPA